MDRSKIHLIKTIDLDTREVKTWKAESALTAWLKDVTLLVAHNGIGYDFPMLTRHLGTKITTKTLDTLILSRLLDPSRETGHSLGSWGEALGRSKTDYAKIWEWMKDRKQAYHGECFDDPIEPLLDFYCEGDVLLLCDLFHHLEEKRQKLGFSQESVDLEHEFAHVIAEQEETGFKLDRQQATMLLVGWNSRLSKIADRAQELYPPRAFERFSEKTGKRLKDGCETFNIGSRQQIARKLIEFGWKPQKHTEKGSVVVDEGVLDDILKSNPSEGLKEFAELVKDYLLLQKRISQVESWLEACDVDGRVRGRVITNGAVTGRCTHHSPNMAQVPNMDAPYGADCRSCWIAEDGWVLEGCDASGLELRMLAHYMQDSKYTEAVINGKSSEGTDIHTINQQAAGLATRSQAKTFIYAFLYGAGPAKIGSIVGGTAKDGSKLTEKFLKQTPALAALKKKLEPYIRKGYVPGLDGRKIWIRSDHAALNSLLQSAGAIVMKKAAVIFYRKVKENNWPVKLVVNVHDELGWETKPEYVDVIGQACVKSIEEAGEHFKLRCPVTGEYKYGRSWSETH